MKHTDLDVLLKEIKALINVNYNVTAPFINGTFTFVPITSSLDVQNITSNTFSQAFNFTANGLSGSRANKFITQE